MKHVCLTVTLAVMMVLLILAGCGQVPPVPNGPQSWGKGEPYTSLRNATIRGAASGQWLTKKHEKMDWREISKLSKAEQESLIAAGYDVWTGQMRRQEGLNPYRVEQVAISDTLTAGKTFDARGKEVQLTCLVSLGNGLFREAKKAPTPTTSFGMFFPRAPEYIEQAPSPIIITACAKQDAKAWSLSHITVERPKKTEGGN